MYVHVRVLEILETAMTPSLEILETAMTASLEILETAMTPSLLNLNRDDQTDFEVFYSDLSP